MASSRDMERYMQGYSNPAGEKEYSSSGGGASSGKASQNEAGYQGPEKGPFQCSNCVHFDGNGGCEIVDGTIDPNGCCNQFSTAGGSKEPDGDEQEGTQTNENARPNSRF